MAVISERQEGKLLESSTISVYIPIPGGSAYYANSSVATIQHPDWLGTKRLATNLSARTCAWDVAYSPYGEQYDTFGASNIVPDFTGDLQDLFSGLWDTPNRELLTNSSRWLSPDPAMASWNAYSYPTNPNSATDFLTGSFGCWRITGTGRVGAML